MPLFSDVFYFYLGVGLGGFQGFDGSQLRARRKPMKWLFPAISLKMLTR